MPSTLPPSRANSATASITGEKRAIAPGPQVVAVGEPARDDDGVHALQVPVAMPEDLRVAVALAGLQRIDFVTGSGEPDDAKASHSTATTS